MITNNIKRAPFHLKKKNIAVAFQIFHTSVLLISGLIIIALVLLVLLSFVHLYSEECHDYKVDYILYLKGCVMHYTFLSCAVPLSLLCTGPVFVTQFLTWCSCCLHYHAVYLLHHTWCVAAALPYCACLCYTVSGALLAAWLYCADLCCTVPDLVLCLHYCTVQLFVALYQV